MTPHHLHATAAAWSLQAALAALQTAAVAAVTGAIDGSRGTAEYAIPSQQFGRRHGLGGHSDPTADLALGAWAPGRPDPCAEALGGILRQLDTVAGLLPGAPGMDPLTRIRQAIPAMSAHAAQRTAEALAHLDQSARRVLHMGPARDPLTRRPCPGCGQRRLEVTTAGPLADRVVVCAADGCHAIWPRHVVLGAVAGAAPTTTN
ncbi:hypothetical protein [Micromonospora peucetia]|uniref:Uncharacterized protein n=1 Tax=Micromonospora peucetia TaxID=47871 RepID=A0ABZ1EJW1_9ACTN|nr:hypothetical protein [Micromonospora peucetia]WSA34533.1 hypothetical protein OIE14_11065 [Micromonospora peucetia]